MKKIPIFTIPSPKSSLVKNFDQQPKNHLVPYRIGYYLLALFGVLTIIIAKEIDFLIYPKLLVEDGSIFFADAFNLPLLRSLTFPYAGYYHLIPRLIGEASQLLPFAYAPLFFNIVSLLISTFCLSWFVLPHFRHIVASDFLRLVFALMLPLLPSSEGFLIVAYLQWPLFVWCLLVCVMDFPKSKWLQLGIAGFYIFTIPTIAIQIILLPLWLIRLRFLSSLFEKRWVHSLIIMQELMALLFLLVPSSAKILSFSDFLVALTDFFHSFLYKGVFVNLIGYQLAERLFHTWGWNAFYVGGVILVSLTVKFVWQYRVQRVPIYAYIGLIYVALVALLLFYVTRPHEIGYRFTTDPIYMAQQNSRYFWPTSVALLLALFIAVDIILKNSVNAKLKQSILVASLGSVMVLHLSGLRSDYWGDDQWHRYADLLDYLTSHDTSHTPKILSLGEVRKTTADTNAVYRVYLPLIASSPKAYPIPKDSLGLKIPIKPSGWWMNLYLSNYSNKIVQLPEQLTWLGYHHQVDHQSMIIELFWQGDRLADPINNVYYTAYVHLVDAQQNRLAGSDVLLKPSETDADASNGATFFSIHEVRLPDQLPTGQYSLVIGLYHFDPANSVAPGSSLMIENSVKILSINYTEIRMKTEVFHSQGQARILAKGGR